MRQRRRGDIARRRRRQDRRWSDYVAGRETVAHGHDAERRRGQAPDNIACVRNLISRRVVQRDNEDNGIGVGREHVSFDGASQGSTVD